MLRTLRFSRNLSKRFYVAPNNGIPIGQFPLKTNHVQCLIKKTLCSATSKAEQTTEVVETPQADTFNKVILLTIEAKLSKLAPQFMKSKMVYFYEFIDKNVAFEDKKYNYILNGLDNLHLHVAKVRMYFRFKSPFNKLELLGTAVYEKEGLLTALYRLNTMKSGLLTTYNPIYFLLKKNANMRYIEGALDMYINKEGLVSKIINRETTFADIEAAREFSKLKAESEEAFRKRFEADHAPKPDPLNWRDMFKWSKKEP